MLPTLHLAIGPCARERDGHRSQHCGIDHQQQNAIADKVASNRAECQGELCRVLKCDLVVKGIVSNHHHRASDTDGKGCSDERVQSCPPEVGEPKPFLSDATLLEEELPGGDGCTDNSDHKEHKTAGNTPGWHCWNDGVVGHSRPMRMHHEGKYKPGQIHQAERDNDALPAKVAPSH